jgi:tRNA-specific 2-thiouridylase
MTKITGENKKVVVGMSGGVDSSVAAYILKQQGFEVIGLHMKSSNSETSVDDEKSAMLVAEKLGIELVVIDYDDEMQQVKDYFINEYKNGKTSKPTV